MGDYLNSLIIWQADTPYLSKLNVLTNPRILFDIGEATGNLASNTEDAICILASSGIPIGIISALYAGKPTYFFHRMGWQRAGLPLYIMPQPPPHIKIGIVDSHVRTGFTSRACYQELTASYRNLVPSITAPVIFEPYVTYKCKVEYQSLSSYPIVLRLISKIIQKPASETDTIIRDLRGKFWSYPPAIEMPLDEFKAETRSSKAIFMLPRRAPTHETKLVSTETEKLIRSRIKPSDEGIWDFFQDPDMIKTICKIAGDAIEIDKFDYVVGVQQLGTALAVSLAYCNRNQFRGQLVSWLGQAGFLPRIDNWKEKRVLVVSLRLQFGTYLADVVNAIQKGNGHVSDILIAIPDYKTSSRFNRYRQNSFLGALADLGIHFWRLS